MSAEKPPIPPSEPNPEGTSEGIQETGPKVPVTPEVTSQSPSETPITEEQKERFRVESESLERIKNRLEARKNKSEKPKEKPKSEEKGPESTHEEKHEKGHGGGGHGKEPFKPYGARDWATAGGAAAGILAGGYAYEGLIAPAIINWLGLSSAVTHSLTAVGLGAGFFGVASATVIYLGWNYIKELWAERNNFLKEIGLGGLFSGTKSKGAKSGGSAPKAPAPH